MKKTEWLPATVKPVRRGIYEFRYKGGPVVLRTRFNGEFQLLQRRPNGDWQWSSFACLLNLRPENYEWRGLTEKST